MAKNVENEFVSSSINIISIGTTITGDIISDGDIRIDGTLKGTLVTKGKVVVGTTGVISGKINSKNSEISGNVEGKINVNELLSLKASAKVVGDIITNKLAIEPNAMFSGTCNMKGMGTVISDKQLDQRPHEPEKSIK
jgi:cytoskeletal protein CcmA (bactofilin family)